MCSVCDSDSQKLRRLGLFVLFFFFFSSLSSARNAVGQRENIYFRCQQNLTVPHPTSIYSTLLFTSADLLHPLFVCNWRSACWCVWIRTRARASCNLSKKTDNIKVFLGVELCQDLAISLTCVETFAERRMNIVCGGVEAGGVIQRD